MSEIGYREFSAFAGSGILAVETNVFNKFWRLCQCKENFVPGEYKGKQVLLPVVCTRKFERLSIHLAEHKDGVEIRYTDYYERGWLRELRGPVDVKQTFEEIQLVIQELRTIFPDVHFFGGIGFSSVPEVMCMASDGLTLRWKSLGKVTASELLFARELEKQMENYTKYQNGEEMQPVPVTQKKHDMRLVDTVRNAKGTRIVGYLVSDGVTTRELTRDVVSQLIYAGRIENAWQSISRGKAYIYIV